MAKILLVEDDRYLISMICDALKLERIEVESVEDGRIGLDMLMTHEYDMAILDWELPGITGVELCKTARSRGRTLNILMLTGKSLIQEKETGFDAGADDYLTKPFNMRELLARVKAALRRTAGAAPDGNLKCDDIRLDPKCFMAWRGEEPLALVRKEFNLLEFLLRHPNQVFSTESLIEHVWGRDSEVSEDAVRVVLNRLRKKLNSAGKRSDVLESIYGVGYRLNS